MSAARPSENFSFTTYYWWFQTGGWTLFLAINGAVFSIGGALNASVMYWLIIAWLLCTGLTEFLRWTIIRFHWLKLRSIQVVPRVLIMVLLLSTVMASFA